MNTIQYNQRAFFSTTIRTKISDAQIRKYINDERVRQIKDDRLSLYLRFNAKRTGGSWWWLRYDNGQQFQYRIGTYPATCAKEVMNLVSAVSVQVAKGEKIACDRFQTVDELLQWHLKRQTNLNQLKRNRLINLKSMINWHLKDAFNCVNIVELNRALIDEKLIQPMLEKGYSISYLQAHFNVLKTACSLAKEVNHIAVNPLADVLFKHFFSQTFSLKAHQIKGCKLSNEQVPELLNKLRKLPVPQRMLILMMFGHGSRIGETRQACWEDISFANKTWTIPSHRTKTGKEMIYPLTRVAIRFLKAYQRWQKKNCYASHRLFPLTKTSRKPIHKERASAWVRDVSKRQWTAHDLRKRARSIWQELGIDYIVCESLLNHAKDNLDEAYIYSHMEQKKREALDRYHIHLNQKY